MFRRDVANITMDLGTVEEIDLGMLAGNDVVTASPGLAPLVLKVDAARAPTPSTAPTRPTSSTAAPRTTSATTTTTTTSSGASSGSSGGSGGQVQQQAPAPQQGQQVVVPTGLAAGTRGFGTPKVRASGSGLMVTLAKPLTHPQG